MTSLIVYQGLGDYNLRSSNEPVLVYRIGGGRVIGDFKSLNDWQQLNEYAEHLRDSYAEWVYTFNDLFLRSGLDYDGLSLFFLSDFSCKRSEIFKTFSTICNLHVLKGKLEGVAVSHTVLVGATPAFVDAFRSVFPNQPVTIENPAAEVNDWTRRLVSDVRYFFELAVVAIANAARLLRSTRRTGPVAPRMYFSPYPQMFLPTFSDIKYGNLVGSQDCHCVSIVMDGLHQHVASVSFFKLRKRLQDRSNFILVDDELALSDVFRGFRWTIATRAFLWRHRKRQWIFAGIDVSRYIRTELSLSVSRISRLVSVMGAFKRFFARTKVKEFVYYLHEFPFGRMLSHVLGSHYPNVRRIGFQHGPASWRKLFYFMAENEASVLPPYRQHAPIPDAVLAEDEDSRRIYEKAGYKNVQVMDEIYRLGYLRPLARAQNSLSVLIAPGLHDARLILDALSPEIQQNPHTQYLLKLHPRAKKEELSVAGVSNLVFTEKPIQELLELVGKVYVTYSSVGLEANSLGIEVEVVNVPGVINESPLLPKLM